MFLDGKHAVIRIPRNNSASSTHFDGADYYERFGRSLTLPETDRYSERAFFEYGPYEIPIDWAIRDPPPLPQPVRVMMNVARLSVSAFKKLTRLAPQRANYTVPAELAVIEIEPSSAAWPPLIVPAPVLTELPAPVPETLFAGA